MAGVLVYSGVTLAVVLLSDLGRRRVAVLRVLHPLFTAGIVMGFFIKTPPTGGPDLALQGAGVLVGAILGFLAARWFMRVDYQPSTRRAYSTAGLGYAALWVVVLGLRAAFVYGFQNLFTADTVSFLTAHHLHVVAMVDALIYIPLAMLVLRTVTLSARARTAKRTTARRPSPEAILRLTA